MIYPCLISIASSLKSRLIIPASLQEKNKLQQSKKSGKIAVSNLIELNLRIEIDWVRSTLSSTEFNWVQLPLVSEGTIECVVHIVAQKSTRQQLRPSITSRFHYRALGEWKSRDIRTIFLCKKELMPVRLQARVLASL